MAKTCIICNEPAGSGEHVFPASLGGRRVNKGIYCNPHDNGYSSLLNELAKQLDIFNALLGVRPDHGKEVKSAVTHDQSTGKKLRLSIKGMKFEEPSVVRQNSLLGHDELEMSFPDEPSMQKWISEQRIKGVDIKALKKAEVHTYFTDELHVSKSFGGRYGLAALAYIAQTFLAQEFPSIARSDAVKAFKQYTTSEANACFNDVKVAEIEFVPPIWWDFNQDHLQTNNTYDFGHRIIVGTDAIDGLIYGRISLFSTFHFSLEFGKATDLVESKFVTIDIDPLADHPPNDVTKIVNLSSEARINRPVSQTAELAISVSNGKAEQMLKDFMGRIKEFSLQQTAQAMFEELKDAKSLSKQDKNALFVRTISNQQQLLWNMLKYSISEFKEYGKDPRLVKILDELIANDTTSNNGLSPLANQSLKLACEAMLHQMLIDFEEGKLTTSRLEDLMGRGPGMAVVAMPVLHAILQ